MLVDPCVPTCHEGTRLVLAPWLLRYPGACCLLRGWRGSVHAIAFEMPEHRRV